jgi:hypothetical protein
MVRIVLVGLAACIAPAAVADAAAAAGAAMTNTNVFYDPPSGPTDPGCKAPLPARGGGNASATYTASDNAYQGSFEWSVPGVIEAGATARIKVTAQSNNNGGYSAAIALKPAGEFGTNAGARQQIEAGVPPGGPGTKSDEENYRFTPIREFNADEKLYMRIEFGCATIIYEFTGIAPSQPAPQPSPCASAAMVFLFQAAPCATKSIAAPAPGTTAAVTSPTPFGKTDRTSAVTVSSTSGSLGGTTIVAEGERTIRQALGEAVAACWLIGPEALAGSNAVAREVLKSKGVQDIWKEVQDDPRRAMKFCLEFAKVLQRHYVSNPARPAQAGCATRRIAFRGRVRRGKTVSLRLVEAKPRSSAVRYTCAAAGDGRVKLIADGRKAGGLKKQLGARLDLGVARRPNASKEAFGLGFGFSRG